MLRIAITLTEKKQLTHDVYELTYACPEMSQELPKPGQYVMFQLAPGLNRAYSIAIIRENELILIIKRVIDGKGSPIICDALIGTTFPAMIPLGHFTLRDTAKSKCFIGTGTGFAPLYCQMLASSKSESIPSKVGFIFGVRNFVDSFYEEEISHIGTQFEYFEYVQYFSKETNFEGRLADHESRTGYVTDWIIPEHIVSYEEFYICGSPAMVKSAREKLEALEISKDQIFWEQF